MDRPPSTITLRVTDSDLISMTTQTVQIGNAAPTVELDDVTGAVEGSETWIPYSTADVGTDTVGIQGTPDCGTGDYLGEQFGYLVCRFPDGPATETVSVTVVDDDGATATATAEVEVVDVAPTLTLGSLAHTAGAPTQFAIPAVVDPGLDSVTSWIVHWGDGTAPTTSSTPNPSHNYPSYGPYSIVVDVIDDDGTHLAVGTTTAFQADTVAPVITSLVLDDAVLEATGPGGAVVNYTVTASDDRGVDSYSCYPRSGSVVPLGETDGWCFAVDAANNFSAAATFTVTVVDTTPPVLDVTDPTVVEASGPGGAVVPFPVTAHDLVDGDVVADCDPAPSTVFALGPTPVHCSFADSRGNGDTADFVVSVVDTRGPDIAIPTVAPVEATGAHRRRRQFRPGDRPRRRRR